MSKPWRGVDVEADDACTECTERGPWADCGTCASLRVLLRRAVARGVEMGVELSDGWSQGVVEYIAAVETGDAEA